MLVSKTFKNLNKLAKGRQRMDIRMTHYSGCPQKMLYYLVLLCVIVFQIWVIKSNKFTVLSLLKFTGFYCVYVKFHNTIHQTMFSLFNLFTKIIPVPFLSTLYVQTESLILSKQVGIQMEKLYFSGKVERLFVDTGKSNGINKYRDVIINEAITPWQTYYHLAIVIDKHEKLLVPFFAISPRYEVLKVIYRHFKYFMQDC
ncbi:unnamed protein product [Moneuplotes crassus]|uniref:Phosphatidylinositol N-acetylglucosaminyltransferase subunit H conserved domain-containing protein n=1 Tax=Euplotes crassus TaxID=5936 RepID=A0AAD1XX83_EUPCR|nr:unnamed protein product [Moneuplotes crassus]